MPGRWTSSTSTTRVTAWARGCDWEAALEKMLTDMIVLSGFETARSTMATKRTSIPTVARVLHPDGEIQHTRVNPRRLQLPPWHPVR